MLVFAAFTPHTPVLLEEIGGEKTKKLAKTLKALAGLEAELYASQPETIIIIGGHSNVALDYFRLPFSEIFRTSFKEVGDYSLHKEFKADLPLIQTIKERSMGKIHLNLFPEKLLDYGLGAPLHLLASKIQGVKIVPIHHSLLSLGDHRKLGINLREVIENTASRIAVIASGELSHALLKNNSRGKEFDELIISSIKNGRYEDIFALDDNFVVKSQECGLRPMTILLGMLEGYANKSEILNYESPLGVGHLTVDFKIR